MQMGAGRGRRYQIFHASSVAGDSVGRLLRGPTINRNRTLPLPTTQQLSITVNTDLNLPSCRRVATVKCFVFP